MQLIWFMQILVVFMESEPITVKSIRAIHSQISSSQGLHGLILVLQSKMNHFAQKELTTYPFTVETFPVSSFLFCHMMKHLSDKSVIFGSSCAETWINNHTGDWTVSMFESYWTYKQIGDLLVNITKHAQQPKIEILTKEEKNELLKEYALEDKQVCFNFN